jgi:hypothetical protein
MNVRLDSWSRRRFVRTGEQIAALAAALPKYEARAQFSRSEPIRDERLTFVTTTESAAWRDGLIFKPAFNWTVLNLNVDSADAGGNRAPVDGFGACFNELGWTSVKVPIVVALSSGALALSYDVGVRATWVGALLNGRRYARWFASTPSDRRMQLETSPVPTSAAAESPAS